MLPAKTPEDSQNRTPEHSKNRTPEDWSMILLQTQITKEMQQTERRD